MIPRFLIVLLCVSIISHSAAAQKSKSASFLVVSDIHLDLAHTQADMRDSQKYRNSGTDLWAATQVKVREVLQRDKPSFLLVLGDMGRHGYKQEDEKSQLSIMTKQAGIDSAITVLKRLADAQRIPLIFAPGNNDIPGDHDGTFSARRFTPSLNLPQLARTSGVAKKADDLGYYSLHPVKGLRVIVLNTVLYLKDNETKEDTFNQMKWMERQLDSLENANGEHALIVMHVPPQEWASSKKYGDVVVQDEFKRIIARYSQIITAILTSHTHRGEVRLYDDLLSLSIPGITPGHGNYPAIELVDYDPKTWEIENFTYDYYKYDATSKDEIKSWGDASFSFFKVMNQPVNTPLHAYMLQNKADIKTMMHSIKTTINDPTYTQH